MTCAASIIYPIILKKSDVLFAAPTPQAYVQSVIKFMKKVIVAIESSMIVGQRVVGTAQGCTFPSITWFLVRRYFMSAYDIDPIK